MSPSAWNPDEDAFRRWVEAHQGQGYAIAWRLLGDHARAWDVVQEALIVLYNYRDSVEETMACGFLATVVTRKAIDLLRSRSHELMAPAGEVVAPASSNTLMELDRRRVADAMVGLSARQRDVIILRIWEGLSFVEIARILGITAGATKTHFKRGLSRLREILSDLAPSQTLGNSPHGHPPTRS